MDRDVRMFVEVPQSVEIDAPADVELIQVDKHLDPPDLGGIKVMMAEPGAVLEDLGHSRVAAAAAESAQSEESGMLRVDIASAKSLDLAEVDVLAQIARDAGLTEFYVYVDKAR